MIENSAALDLAVGRSRVRQRILALLMDDPGSRLHLREIQRRANTSPGTASRELARLVAAGLIHRAAEGNQVYFRASNSPLAAMLRSVIVAVPARQGQPGPARQGQPNAGGRVKQAGGLPSAAAPASAASKVSRDTVATLPGLHPAAPSARATAEEPEPRARIGIGLDPASAPPASRDSGPVEPAATTSPPPRVVRTTARPSRPEPDPVGLRIARRLADEVRGIYGGSARGVFLYGPRASGPAPADADVETIVILDRVGQYGAELERTSHVCAALSREAGLIVSRIFVDESEWNAKPDGALAAIRAEAVAL